MRHLYTCIDFIEQSPANDNSLPPPQPRTLRRTGAAVIDRIPKEWVLLDHLREEARIAGVFNPDIHLERLKAGPVGGARGIFEDHIEDYVRSLFPKWRTWEETDRAKTPQAPTAVTPVAPGERVKGWPAWVRKSQVEQLKAEGRDAAALAKLFARTHHIPPNNLDVNLAAQAFETFLERVRKEAA